jgi:hypothetical protein
LVLAPLEKRFLPKIVSASTWKNFSDLASFQIERREEGWRRAPQMKFVGNTITWILRKFADSWSGSGGAENAPLLAKQIDTFSTVELLFNISKLA